jgi:hypothetical protein
MNTRNGKIARLPREIREELNQRLERSEPGSQLLAWLNALEEVREVLKDEFDGVPISKQNLSEWRQGGFEEWLARQDLWAKVLKVKDFAGDLGEDRDNVVADDVATVMAAHYAALISDWDGEVDAKFEARARMLNGLCRGVVQLQRGMHRAKKENDDFIRGLEEEDRRRKEEIKNKRVDRMYSMLREPQIAQIFGGGELGRKIAKYIIEVENDIPGAKLELPDNKKIEKPAKPTRKQQTAKRANKTTAKTIDKQLEENEMENESPQDQSNPVKPGQTGLEQPQEGEPAVAEAMAGKLGVGLGTEEMRQTFQARTETGGRGTGGM